jgi:protein-S-isoprenylcysteine O-methyltransferase Ste14
MIKSKPYFFGISCLAVLFLFVFISSFANAAERFVKDESSESFATTNDTLLVLNIETHYGARVLCVSFNGNEGTEGTLQIKQNDVVLKTAHFELIKHPYYASVDISNLGTGSYDVTLTTSAGIHSSTIIIQ